MMESITSLITAMTLFLLLAAVLFVIFWPGDWARNKRKELLQVLALVRGLRAGGLQIMLKSADDGSAPAEGFQWARGEAVPPEMDAGEGDHGASEESRPLKFVDVLKTIEGGEYRDAMRVAEPLLAEFKPEERDRMRGFLQHYAHKHGNREALQDLEQAVRDHPRNEGARQWLISSRLLIEDFEGATSLSEKGVELAVTEGGKTQFLASLADGLFGFGRQLQAIDRLRLESSSISDPNLRGQVLHRLGDLYHKLGGHELEAFALWERAVALQPGESDSLFAIAQHYTEKKAPAMALYYYRKILSLDREHGAAINNTGVAAKELGLHISAVNFYKRSRDAGNTLAAANLAFVALGAGFADHADEILDATLQEEDVHPNVNHARSKIAEDRETDRKNLQQIVEDAQARAEVNKLVAEALLRNQNPSLAKRYAGTPAELSLEESETHHIRGVFRWNDGGPEYQLTGTRRGCIIEFTWKDHSPNPPQIRSLMDLAIPASSSGVGLLVVDGDALRGVSRSGTSLFDARDWRRSVRKWDVGALH